MTGPCIAAAVVVWAVLGYRAFGQWLELKRPVTPEAPEAELKKLQQDVADLKVAAAFKRVGRV